VNTVKSPETSSKFYATGEVPMIVFFSDKRPLLYNGPLTGEDIFYWSLIALSPVSLEVKCEDFTNEKETLNKVVIFYGDIESEAYLNEFTDLAKHGALSRRFNFIHLLDDACAKGYGFTKKP
jgi:hypothetical protein